MQKVTHTVNLESYQENKCHIRQLMQSVIEKLSLVEGQLFPRT